MFTVEFVKDGAAYGKTVAESYGEARGIVGKLKIKNPHWDMISGGFLVFDGKGVVARVLNVNVDDNSADVSDDELIEDGE